MWLAAALAIVAILTTGVALYIGRVQRERDRAVLDMQQVVGLANAVRPDPDSADAVHRLNRKIEAERGSARHAAQVAEAERDAARQAREDDAQQMQAARLSLELARRDMYDRQLIEIALLVNHEPDRARRFFQDDRSRSRRMENSWRPEHTRPPAEANRSAPSRFGIQPTARRC